MQNISGIAVRLVLALFVWFVGAVVARGETVLVGWTFPETNLVADAGVAGNMDSTNRFLTAVGELGTLSFPSTQRSAPSYNGWNGGAGTNSWLISFTTAAYTNITVSSKQRSSGAAPQYFSLQYRVGGQGDWQAISGGDIVLADNWTTGVVERVGLPIEAWDQGLVQVRWLMSSETSVSNGFVSSAGASGIDDVFVRGVLRDDLPVPGAPVALAATSVKADRFMANWGVVTGNVAGYELEVATSDQFRREPTVLVNFEGDGETTPSNDYNVGERTISGLNWFLTDTLIGDVSFGVADWLQGARALRMRGLGASSFVLNDSLSNGLTDVSFQYRRYGTDSQVDWRVEYSTDQGQSWVQIGADFTAPASDAVQTFSETVDIAVPVRVRIKRATEIGSDNKRLNIDNIELFDAFSVDEYVSGYDPYFTPGTSVLVAGLETNKVHYYRVRTVGLDGAVSGWSDVQRVNPRPPTVLILF